jgi:DNA (cytosine-5)-methyltransferase 1
MIEITAGDFLAGGGGVTEAMNQVPGMKVKWVLNHDKTAIRTNLFHHKQVKHFWADLYKQDEHEMEPVDFAWASIECTQHSTANGGREKKLGSYMLGWELVRYTKHLQPLVLGIENVPEFKKWAPLKDGVPDGTRKGEEFEKWKAAICAMGYDYSERIMNAADFGIPTRRVRYFAFFVSKSINMQVRWPEPTHNRFGTNGLKKWVACKNYIDLGNEGNSIFGREFNADVKKGKRKPLSHNTLKRIAGGIKKYAPELSFIFQYYGSGLNTQQTTAPLNTVRTKDCHALVTVEKKHFVQDHVQTDNFHTPEDPLNPVLTRQTKQLITLEKIQFLQDYYGRFDTAHALDVPANTIRTENSKHLVTIDKNIMVQHFSGNHSSSPDEPLPTITTTDHNALVTATAQFISPQYNSNGNPEANNHPVNEPLKAITTEPKNQLISVTGNFVSHHFGTGVNQSVDEPVNAITTHEKSQFISAYFNSSGNPSTQNQGTDQPLGTITTGTNKHALVTAIENGEIEFDIKMRFLEPEELSRISTFPKQYFTNPLLKLTKKEQVKLIGNAVPVDWARQIIAPVVADLQEVLIKQEAI